jgi:hypothetical protein
LAVNIKKKEKMNWLQGGPYYQLSFLIRNQEDKEHLLNLILSKMSRKADFEIVIPIDKLKEKTKTFIKGYEDEGLIRRNIDINIKIGVSGIRKSRLFIEELSDELAKVNFWFFGSRYDADEWGQLGLKEENKPEFKNFFQFVREQLNPVLGTIAYEEDCSDLFDTEEKYPSEFYKTVNLQLDKIRERIHQNKNAFEYCWINANVFGNDENIEIEIKTE